MYNEYNHASHAPLETWKGPKRLEAFAGTVMTALLAVIVLLLLTVRPAHACAPTVVKGLLPTDNTMAVVEMDVHCALETSGVLISGYDQLRHVYENGHVSAQVLPSMAPANVAHATAAVRPAISPADQLRHVYENGHVSAQVLQSMDTTSEQQDTVVTAYEELVRRAVASGMVPAQALQSAPVAQETHNTVARSYEELVRRAVESGMVPAEALQSAPAAGESPATSPFSHWISPADQFRYVMENGHVSAEVWAMAQAQDAGRVATQSHTSNDLP